MDSARTLASSANLPALSCRVVTQDTLGGAKGIRTPDLLIANETRYQLRHSPMPLSRYLEIVHDPGASTQN